MPLSKPMEVFAVRLPEDERENLRRIVAERNVTFSYAIREGLKFWVAELADDSDRVAMT